MTVRPLGAARMASRRGGGRAVCALAVAAAAWVSPDARGATTADLVEGLRKLDANVGPPALRDGLRGTVPADLARRLRAANLRSSEEWGTIRSRRDWERFRDEKLTRLRESLGTFPEVPRKPDIRVSGTVRGEGFRIDKLLYQTRPGLWVTANLYRPAAAARAMPGILICHSHHAPKEQAELQDMGMTWGRAGCLVLVPDLLGHGERRQHPFATADDYARPFRAGRQDYYFRYDVGMQLHLAGESLMGWLVWDLRRGIDVLLAQDGVDPKRIVLLGAVAGGGDPAAVAAALDERVQAAVVFNFGGPQPESPYPLGEGAEQTFHYAGGGSFESTRNLRRSAADGFLPWVIVGSIAPRRLIYAHEFSWDRDRDPVWQRLGRIWDLYGAGDLLAGTSGRGVLREKPPQATHCTNIGRVHRQSIHPLLRRWLDIPVGPEDEYSNPLGREELAALTPDLAAELNPRRLCDLLPELADRRIGALRAKLHGLPFDERSGLLRTEWGKALGDVEPPAGASAEAAGDARPAPPGMHVERLLLRVEPGIAVPILLLRPAGSGSRTACVVALAEGGKAALLRHRADDVARLLAGGAAVCLPDLRGTGQTRPAGSRERWGEITAQSSTELMLGGTTVGARLRDLRAVLRYLAARGDLDPARTALWADSLTEPNPPDAEFRAPHNVDGRADWSEPIAPLLALLGALYEDGIAAVFLRGGLSDFRSILESPFVCIPHDAVIPGAVAAGDLPLLAAALAPRPVRLEALIDGLNRLRDADSLRALYQPAADAYRQARADARFAVVRAAGPAAPWLLEALRPR